MWGGWLWRYLGAGKEARVERDDLRVTLPKLHLPRVRPSTLDPYLWKTHSQTPTSPRDHVLPQSCFWRKGPQPLTTLMCEILSDLYYRRTPECSKIILQESKKWRGTSSSPQEVECWSVSVMVYSNLEQISIRLLKLEFGNFGFTRSSPSWLCHTKITTLIDQNSNLRLLERSAHSPLCHWEYHETFEEDQFIIFIAFSNCLTLLFLFVAASESSQYFSEQVHST